MPKEKENKESLTDFIDGIDLDAIGVDRITIEKTINYPIEGNRDVKIIIEKPKKDGELASTQHTS